MTSLLFQNGGREYIIAQDIFLFLLLLLFFFFFLLPFFLLLLGGYDCFVVCLPNTDRLDFGFGNKKLFPSGSAFAPENHAPSFVFLSVGGGSGSGGGSGGVGRGGVGVGGYREGREDQF